jgi:hypothetical protein
MIAEHWARFDFAELMKQLGASPTQQDLRQKPRVRGLFFIRFFARLPRPTPGHLFVDDNDIGGDEAEQNDWQNKEKGRIAGGGVKKHQHRYDARAYQHACDKVLRYIVEVGDDRKKDPERQGKHAGELQAGRVIGLI